MTWVLDEAPVKDSTQTLVLLCLADWADDSGLCWPSIDSVARRARCSESTARRSVRKLEDAGLLVREGFSRGRATNRYRIITNPGKSTGLGSDTDSYPQVTNPVKMTPCQIDRVESPTLAPVTANPGVGDTPTLAPVTPEPSLNPQEPPAAASGGGELDETTTRIDELESVIRAVGLAARFDRLSAHDRTAIRHLIDLHGAQALAAHAKAQHRPMDPAKFANAWIESWKALPAPGFLTVQLKPACECDNGWLDADTACPTCRPNLLPRARMEGNR